MPEGSTPYILATAGFAMSLLTGVLAWLIKKVIDQGNHIVALQTAFKYYLDTTGKGAAIVLDSPNPTPPEMSVLLRKYREGTLTIREKDALCDWLKQVIGDPHEVGKRGAALSLLAAIGGIERLQQEQVA